MVPLALRARSLFSSTYSLRNIYDRVVWQKPSKQHKLVVLWARDIPQKIDDILNSTCTARWYVLRGPSFFGSTLSHSCLKKLNTWKFKQRKRRNKYFQTNNYFYAQICASFHNFFTTFLYASVLHHHLFTLLNYFKLFANKVWKEGPQQSDL